MNVKNETARILRAHTERAASANAGVKIYFKLYRTVIEDIFTLGSFEYNVYKVGDL